MAFRFRSAEDQVTDIRVCHDIAHYFLKANIFSLHTSRESRACFYSSPDKIFDLRRNFVFVTVQDNGYSNRRKIIPPEIPAILWRIIWMWVDL